MGPVAPMSGRVRLWCPNQHPGIRCPFSPRLGDTQVNTRGRRATYPEICPNLLSSSQKKTGHHRMAKAIDLSCEHFWHREVGHGGALHHPQLSKHTSL